MGGVSVLSVLSVAICLLVILGMLGINGPFGRGSDQNGFRLTQPAVATAEEWGKTLDPAVDAPTAFQKPFQQRRL